MIVFDTETTGLENNTAISQEKQSRIIELFALKVNDQTLEIEDELELLIDPGEKLTDEIVKITGITDDMVRGQGSFGKHFKDIQRFWLGETYAVGHNLSFDVDMLWVEIGRLGRLNAFPWCPVQICTVEASEHIHGRRLKLIDLHTELFGEGFEAAHRARNDVMATYRCAKELINRDDIVLSF
jgi:DNA polymerase III epsilon subunit-like protein